jgi:flagellar biosynthetic protein FliQ
MTEAYVLSLAQSTTEILLVLAGPFLIISLVVGCLISLIQAATQLNESTLTFVPKIVGVGLVMLFLGSWMLERMLVFTASLFNNLPNLIH